jgi:hypothetical protein
MDIEKQSVMGNHMHHTYHMWLTRDTQAFSSSLRTVTFHVTVFNLLGGYQAFKGAHYLHLHHKVKSKHHTTHCQNANATEQACTTVNTTMLHT